MMENYAFCGIHKLSTGNNPPDLMTKCLETTKIKKHSQSLGLHGKHDWHYAANYAIYTYS
eukprot:6467025-Amphidinium_carterae.2